MQILCIFLHRVCDFFGDYLHEEMHLFDHERFDNEVCDLKQCVRGFGDLRVVIHHMISQKKRPAPISFAAQKICVALGKSEIVVGDDGLH